MTLLAALLTAISVYLAVGYITGLAPDLRWRIDKETSGLSDRRVWLMQAGAQVSPGQFLFWSLVLGLFAFVIGMALTGV